MNKRRRYKAKRRARALVIAWQHCRVMQGVLRHEGFDYAILRPTAAGVQAVMHRRGMR